ncbi:MAG TPA: TetR/AcrR family transcriptional regulator [Alcaligenaceae bacterium]|nr:TetR/AcrR family transcriptional regulator [Alcaligenaceae bacterium]
MMITSRSLSAMTPAIGREKLLLAAQHAFSHYGYAGSSVRTICQNAQLDASMIAHHFGSKANLWLAVANHLATQQQKHLQPLEQVFSLAQTTKERFILAGDVLISLFADLPEIALLINQELGQPGERLDHLNIQLIQPGYAICGPIWQESMHNGLLRTQNPVIFHLLIIGALGTVLSASSTLGVLSGQHYDQNLIKKELQHTLRQLAQNA